MALFISVVPQFIESQIRHQVGPASDVPARGAVTVFFRDESDEKEDDEDEDEEEWWWRSWRPSSHEESSREETSAGVVVVVMVVPDERTVVVTTEPVGRNIVVEVGSVEMAVESERISRLFSSWPPRTGDESANEEDDVDFMLLLLFWLK